MRAALGEGDAPQNGAESKEKSEWFGCIAWWHMLLAYAMNMQRSAKLFRNGRSQAVRIPREFEFPGKDVIIRKEGDKLIIESTAKPKDTLAEWLATLEPLDEEFPQIPDLPADPVDL